MTVNLLSNPTSGSSGNLIPPESDHFSPPAMLCCDVYDRLLTGLPASAFDA